MPRAEDQLSKLTGTAFLCVTIGFMLPSVGTKGDLENYSNAAALSLSVIVVIVNVCLQMSTGLIFSFLVVEHAIMLFFMLVLLVEFWFMVIDINTKKGEDKRGKEYMNELLIEQEETVKNRLCVSYIHGFIHSPQFVICKLLSVSVVASVCTGCSVVLLEAIFRVLVFPDSKLCSGVSDYKWSVWLIVVIQILSVILVSFAVVCRWLTNMTHRDKDMVPMWYDYSQLFCLFASTNLPASLEICCRYILFVPYLLRSLLQFVDIFVASIIQSVTERCRRSESQDLEPALRSLLEKYLLHLDWWPTDKALEDMARCVEKNKHDFPKHLVKLLSTIPPSEEGLNGDTSCASLILLVEIAKLYTPTSLNISLTNILVEVFDDIHFIDSQINIANARNASKSMYAKVIWKYGLISPLVYGKRSLYSYHVIFKQNPTQPDYRVGIIGEFPIIIFNSRNILSREESKIVRLINGNDRSYATSKELYDYIEQLFVNMLRFLLDPTRLTQTIFKYISDSPMEEYEDRVRHCFKLYCKYEGIESLLRTPRSPHVQVGSDSV